jgi:hypothetical protein
VKSLPSGPVTLTITAGLSPTFSSPAVSHLKALVFSGQAVDWLRKIVLGPTSDWHEANAVTSFFLARAS